MPIRIINNNYYPVEGCPIHGKKCGQKEYLSIANISPLSFKCNTCKNYYIHNPNTKYGYIMTHPKKDFKILNTVPPVMQPKEFFILPPRSRDFCMCKDRNKLYEFSGVFLPSGEKVDIRGIQCRICKKTFITREHYQSRYRRFEEHGWTVSAKDKNHLVLKKNSSDPILEEQKKDNNILNKTCKIEPVQLNKSQKSVQPETINESQIGLRDFIIRRSVFKCMNKGHLLKNITASVMVVDKNGNDYLVRINAGYCTQCKVYFILDSTYENLKKRGIPLCRISDEKTYNKYQSANGMQLAQESILMQYGYNVNQNIGLSSKTRKKILAVLLDNNILSKSEIISYLDFFISQRQSQSKYQLAIAKWEDDRDFIENYRIGEYQQYGINGLYRQCDDLHQAKNDSSEIRRGTSLQKKKEKVNAVPISKRNKEPVIVLKKGDECPKCGKRNNYKKKVVVIDNRGASIAIWALKCECGQLYTTKKMGKLLPPTVTIKQV